MTLVVPFIESHRNSEHIALSDEQRSMTYRALHQAVLQRAETLKKDVSIARPVVILHAHNSIECVVNYLALLALDWVVMLLHPATPDALVNEYANRYNTNLRVSEEAITVLSATVVNTDPRLSVLLSTSGSTGAGKCVALSQHNILSNCNAILDYLPIEESDITLATLPLSYSYGLSVLNTHLVKGAQCRFTEASVFDKAFWQILKDTPVTSLAGVPSFYEMLLRMRFNRMELPALRYFTQAGGKLASRFIIQLADYAKLYHKQFFVMYGQTEATARMAFVEPDNIARKPGCIGKAIPGGEFMLLDDDDAPIYTVDTPGELCYRGENIMLGYAESAAALSAFSPSAWLKTGDLAKVDADGDYTIVGRKKRMLKVFGERVNLDAIEQLFAEQNLVVKCCGQDNKLLIACTEGDAEAVETLQKARIQLPAAGVKLCHVASFPLLNNGKTDYSSLMAMLLGENA